MSEKEKTEQEKAFEANAKKRAETREKLAGIRARLAEQRKARAERKAKAEAEAKAAAAKAAAKEEGGAK